MHKTAITACLLAAGTLLAGCASATAPAHSAQQAAAAAPATTRASTPPPPPPSRTSRAATGERVVAVRASALPYKPAAGAPALDDVTVLRTSGDRCAIPADDSGNEAQLLGATMDVNIMIVTFEFTNPCPTSLAYDFHVRVAVDSATGKSAGQPVTTTTAVIDPGRSVTLKVPVTPDPGIPLTHVWVGVTHIAKQAD